MSYDTPLSDGDANALVTIASIRRSNNVLWMRLLEIALTTEPLLTKEVLRKINENDGKISELLKELAK